jgi:hypothetical protein
LHAGFTADAPVGTEINDAILALIHCRNGTDRNARWIFAVITARNLKNTPRVRENSLLHVLHPSTIHAHGNFVFGFACDGAGVASDAFAIIDYEAVFHFAGFDREHSIIRCSR